MGHIGLEFAGPIDPEDADGVVIKADFSGINEVWTNPQKLKKNVNPHVKMANDQGFGEEDILYYSLNDVRSNILLFEYQLNPKEIRLIPLSVQYRTAIIEGQLYVKIFLHANPKLPKSLFDFEVQAVLKEREKLCLQQSAPHAIFTKEGINFTFTSLVPDQKY